MKLLNSHLAPPNPKLRLLKPNRFETMTLCLLLCCTFLFFKSQTLWGKEESSFKEVYRPSPLKSTLANTHLEKIETSFHKIFEIYENKVVYINAEKNTSTQTSSYHHNSRFKKFFGQKNSSETQKQSNLGTGFIISKDGYVCTNYHVVEKANTVYVRVGRSEYRAKVMGTDKITDLALLHIENERSFDPVYFGDSRKVRVGDWAVAIGNPFGFDRTFTTGVVSAVRGDQDGLGDSYIQTDASINQGNSGGPLINLHGEVIGVNRMIYAKQGGGSIGIGFAIPINTAKIVLEQLLKNGRVKWGFIGIQLSNLDRNLMRQLGAVSSKGAVVVGVLKDGPADKAGLRRGDVILRVGNQLIIDTNHLIHIISNTSANKQVNFEILRREKKEQIEVTVEERPTGEGE